MGIKYKKLAVTDLVNDDRYQRPLNEKRADKMAETFDSDLFGVLEVSERNGVAAVVDGQHRLYAAEKVGLETVPCLVHTGLDASQEADLFIRFQNQRKNISALEKFRARVFAGEEEAVNVQDAVTAAGFSVRDSRGPENSLTIRAIASLERVYRNYGVDHLRHTLETIALVWNGDDGSADGPFMEGMAALLYGYANRLDEEAFSNLRKAAPVEIIRRARSKNGSYGGGGSGSRAKAVLAELRKVSGVRGRPRIKAEEE